MYKGLRITFSASHVPKQFLRSFVQSKAQQLELEGMAQLVKTEEVIRIFVFGVKEKVDAFVDCLHKDSEKFSLDSLEVEPSIKNKDYRGVFRIVE